VLPINAWVSTTSILPSTGPSRTAGKPVRLCGRVIGQAAQYVRRVEALGGNVQHARAALKAARRWMEQGEEVPALLKARKAILLAKSALPKRRREPLRREGDGLLMAVDLTLGAYEKIRTHGPMTL